MKPIKKYILLLFTAVFVTLSIFSCLPVNKVFAAGLEVVYPSLPSNSNPPTSSDTSLDVYLKYIFDFGILIGFVFVFLSLAYAGVLYFLSPAIPSALAMAKDRISGAISGVLILVLLYLIITTINPYLAIFKLNKPNSPPPTPPTTQSPGVNFYTSTDCSGMAYTNISSISDLGTNLRNKINCVNIVPSSDNKTSYISILYDATNFFGKCEYINPNDKKIQVEPFAVSASIYQFDFSPSGDGVYLYRKPFPSQPVNEQKTKKEGWVKIPNSQILASDSSKFYIEKLSDLKFTGNSTNYNNLQDCNVPDDEQDCIKYDNNGKCAKDGKSCPTLAGENISSIKIKGNYVVLLIYENPLDDGKDWWTSCQIFPTVNDVNKEGPEQIKWENIRSTGKDPNMIMIIPVMQK